MAQYFHSFNKRKETMQQEVITRLQISTPAFLNEGWIPAKYTCEGKNVNPSLFIENLPSGTKSMALIMEDPDAPKGTFVHWLVWNIPPRHKIMEDSIPGVEGINDFGQSHYLGPCPPSGVHRYYFKCYALDHILDLKPNVGKIALLKAVNDHVIGYGELMGRYKKHWDL